MSDGCWHSADVFEERGLKGIEALGELQREESLPGAYLIKMKHALTIRAVLIVTIPTTRVIWMFCPISRGRLNVSLPRGFIDPEVRRVNRFSRIARIRWVR